MFILNAAIFFLDANLNFQEATPSTVVISETNLVLNWKIHTTFVLGHSRMYAKNCTTLSVELETENLEFVLGSYQGLKTYDYEETNFSPISWASLDRWRSVRWCRLWDRCMTAKPKKVLDQRGKHQELW